MSSLSAIIELDTSDILELEILDELLSAGVGRSVTLLAGAVGAVGTEEPEATGGNWFPLEGSAAGIWTGGKVWGT